MNRIRLSQLAAAVATTTVMAACGTDQPQTGQTAERTARRSEALSATSFLGTSLAPKTLALTFDDGPGYGTSDISAYLATQGIPATFFLNGAYIAATTLPNDNDIKLTPGATALLAQMEADGHLVANHGTTHRDLTTVLATFGAAKVVQELAETDADIAAYVPSTHFLFRAPYGAYDANVWNALAPSAMNKYVGAIGWDIGGTTTNYPAQAADWACWVNGLQTGGAGPTFGATPQQCGDAYLSEIGAVGRGIVLMHDSSHTDNGGTTLAMVQYIVPILKTQGYTFVRADSVPQLAALFPPVPCDASCATCSGAGPARCTSCGAGSWLSAGTCHACGSCDDGNACTADTCNADTGCTHAHIDGCGSGAADAGAPATVTPLESDASDDGGTEPAEPAGTSATSDGGAPGSPGGGCAVTRSRARAGDGALSIALGAVGALAAALLRRRRMGPRGSRSP